MHREITGNCLVTTYFGLPEIMENGAKAGQLDIQRGLFVHPECQPKRMGYRDEFIGKNLNSWEDIATAGQDIWKEGLEATDRIRKELQQENIPVPMDRKRKRRWSEDDGDVDVDRVIEGDSYCYQQVKREIVHSTTAITLTVCVGGNCNRTAQDMFWRSAAVVTIADMLEQAGFSCEIIGWAYERNVWTEKERDAFTIMRLKEAGEALDLSYLVNGLSPWAYRVGVCLGHHNLGKRLDMGYGSAYSTIPDHLKEFLRLDASTRAFHMPGDVFNKHAAISAAQTILNQIGQGAVV